MIDGGIAEQGRPPEQGKAYYHEMMRSAYTLFVPNEHGESLTGAGAWDSGLTLLRELPDRIAKYGKQATDPWKYTLTSEGTKNYLSAEIFRHISSLKTLTERNPDAKLLSASVRELRALACAAVLSSVSSLSPEQHDMLRAGKFDNDRGLQELLEGTAFIPSEDKKLYEEAQLNPESEKLKNDARLNDYFGSLHSMTHDAKYHDAYQRMINEVMTLPADHEAFRYRHDEILHDLPSGITQEFRRNYGLFTQWLERKADETLQNDAQLKEDHDRITARKGNWHFLRQQLTRPFFSTDKTFLNGITAMNGRLADAREKIPAEH